MAYTRPINILAHMLLTLLVNFMASLSKESTNNIITDQMALLELKSHIIDDPQNFLKTNWSTSSPVCNWKGVTCGSKHHRVIALDLSNMGLTGTIPPHLGNLSFLAQLILNNNSFYGSLPFEFANLARLKFINLGENNFNGEIPSWFGSFTNLEFLILQDNNFNGTVPSSLYNLSKLEILGMYHNDLKGQIPEAIGNLQSLKTLSLAKNQLSGPIPSAIFNISSLQEISLSDNMLSGSIPFTSLILKGYSLRFIDISRNNLTGHLLSNMFEHLTKLQGLYLSHNLISGKIPSSLFKCRELENLTLASNLLEGRLPEEIGNLTKLKNLYLRNNNLQGEIPQQIGNLINLEMLSLSNNNLTGHIPSVIGNLTLLRNLDFSYNHLTGTIPLNTGNLPNKLEFLTLHSNSLSGPIPPTIFNSSSLKSISLTSNRLLGSLPSSIGLGLPKLEAFTIAENEVAGSIPMFIFNASQLTLLDLSNNLFSGYVPDAFGNLRHLIKLSISFNNNLTADMSVLISSLTNCRNLTHFLFAGNQLIGTHELPSYIGNLSVSLEVFFASSCSIKGRIPMEIGNLSNLISLNLQNNELSGPIPTTMGRLGKLQGLFLNGNNLEGSMPYELCTLERLSYLSLSDNKLSGLIPLCLGDLFSLRYLLLDSNKFTSIPSALMRLKDILLLNLSSNSLSGSLPIEIGNLKVVTYMDLSRNQLSGNIPISFGDLEDLVYLSLSDNKLQSSIPQSVGDLLSLKFLDLSRNNLSGVIPKTLEKLMLLQHFNVSFNRLEGEIPSKGPFLNFSIQSFLGNKAFCGAPRLQIPPCRSNRAIKHLKYILPTILCPTILLIIALIIIFLRRMKRNIKQPSDEENLLALATWRRISHLELSKATDGFCQSKLLGVGSFGSVYQGTLSDGMKIAVKVFNVEIERAFKSFEVECEVLRHIRHRNLVKIISNCCNLDFKALVLEFMPNGSLEKWLYSHNHFLDILQRLNIMIDVAAVLEYLHHGHITSVVHCDLKPSNVLLDEDMVAYLGDFGIAKLLGEENSTIQTMTLATIGYMAPEYGTEGIISIKGDVYSFGILLMETFTRKKPTDEMFSDEMSLKEWVKQCLPSALIQVVDTNLLSSRGRELLAAKDCAMAILQLGGECSADLPEDRIDMKNVVVKLKKIKLKFLKDIERVR